MRRADCIRDANLFASKADTTDDLASAQRYFEDLKWIRTSCWASASDWACSLRFGGYGISENPQNHESNNMSQRAQSVNMRSSAHRCTIFPSATAGNAPMRRRTESRLGDRKLRKIG